jgi:Fe-S cluster biogenesis protein NfuA
MIDPDIAGVIDTLQDLIRADGGDLRVDRIDRDAGTIEMSLVLEGAECIECVMPRPFLEQMALVELSEAAPDMRSVHIVDPREHGQS